MFYKKINRAMTVLILIVASLVFIHCGDRSDNSDSSTEENRTSVYENNQNPNFITAREELVADLKALNEDLNERIENLDSRIEDAGEETDEILVPIRDELKKDRTEVQIALENLHHSTEDTWDRVKTETENLYDRVSSNLDRLEDRLQGETIIN